MSLRVEVIGTGLMGTTHVRLLSTSVFGSEKILTDSVVHDVDTARWLLGQ